METKRLLIENSIHEHRRYGTKWAVEKLLNTLSSGSEVIEWWNYSDTPYHFKLQVKELRDLEDSGERILNAINITKSVRDRLDAFDFNLSKDHPDEILYVAQALNWLDTITYYLQSYFEEYQKLKALLAISVTGYQHFNLGFNSNAKQKLRAGFATLYSGTISYKINPVIDDSTWYSLWLNWIKSRWWDWKDADIIYYKPDEPIDDDEPEEMEFGGNFLKLWFGFHNSDEHRLIIMPFPRDDFTAAEINSIPSENIFVSRRGYYSDKVYRAVLVDKRITRLTF